MTSFQASLGTTNSQRESCQPEVSCRVHLEDCSDPTRTLRSSHSSQQPNTTALSPSDSRKVPDQVKALSTPLKTMKTHGDSTSKPDKTSSSMMPSEVDGSSSTDNPMESQGKTTKYYWRKSQPTVRSLDRSTCRHSSTGHLPTKCERSWTSKRHASLQVDRKCVNSPMPDTTAMETASLMPTVMESATNLKSLVVPMMRPATMTPMPPTTMALARMPIPDTTATATALLTPTKMESATNLKSLGVPMMRPATTTPMPPTKMVRASTTMPDTIAMATASLTQTKTESAMSLKVQDVPRKTHATMTPLQPTTTEAVCSVDVKKVAMTQVHHTPSRWKPMRQTLSQDKPPTAFTRTWSMLTTSSVLSLETTMIRSA